MCTRPGSRLDSSKRVRRYRFKVKITRTKTNTPHSSRSTGEGPAKSGHPIHTQTRPWVLLQGFPLTHHPIGKTREKDCPRKTLTISSRCDVAAKVQENKQRLVCWKRQHERTCGGRSVNVSGLACSSEDSPCAGFIRQAQKY